MYTKTVLPLAIALCVALSFVTVESRLVRLSICDFSCVQDVYSTYCGGATCLYEGIDVTQKENLCTRRCMDALSGKALFSCLKSEKLSDITSQSFQQELVSLFEGKTSSSRIDAAS